ncbi:COX assembly mitochondrial protein homolog isoform X1 [Hypomesus transpacificus]|uniref:COX assembly mitochondrial protein homolog isoform X1 n=1 Tax=Hypomesus transpacificus TaxID=137520 RepID=UPI001F073281|nr:COX assembly mitochondrial protein homolog isoform X1 [Hypomesus transpacificus]
MTQSAFHSERPITNVHSLGSHCTLFCNVGVTLLEYYKMETTKSEPFLRHVETDVLIPKMMREKAKERCAKKVDAFNHCCKQTGFLMAFKCRNENTALKECLTVYYKDPAFYEECKKEYIRDKLEYERTGIPAKNRKQKLPASM